MPTVYLISQDGQKVPTEVSKMYETHGPYMIGDYRLDRLVDVSMLVDSSTSTLHESGAIDTKTNTGSMVGRAVVGGVLLGGAGAAVGGVTASKSSAVNTTTTETRHVELTLKLFFRVGNPLIVIVKSVDAYHWLLGQVGQTEYDEAALKKAEEDSIPAIEEVKRWTQVDKIVKKPVVSEYSGFVGFVGMIAGSIFGIMCGFILAIVLNSFFLIIVGWVIGLFVGMIVSGNALSNELAQYPEKRKLKYKELFAEEPKS